MIAKVLIVFRVFWVDAPMYFKQNQSMNGHDVISNKIRPFVLSSFRQFETAHQSELYGGGRFGS